MKNLKFFLFPVVCLIAGLFVANITMAKASNVPADSLATEVFKIKGEITFGAPPKCEGWGICKFKFECCDGAMQPNVGVGELEAENGHLAIDYLANSMDPQTLRTHFGSGTFVVEAAYVVPDEVTRQLGLRAGYTVQPGRYKIVNNGETLRVVY